MGVMTAPGEAVLSWRQNTGSEISEAAPSSWSPDSFTELERCSHRGEQTRVRHLGARRSPGSASPATLGLPDELGPSPTGLL